MRKKLRPRSGFTLTELMVAIGILVVLTSLLLPVLVNARKSAQRIQCSSQLHQLGMALVTYSNDNIRAGEVYPHYLTDLYNWNGQITGQLGQNGQQLGQGYVADARIFVCPMDNTNATAFGGVPTLKPILNSTTPYDNKSCWAERVKTYNFSYLGSASTVGGNQANCSYLYEFSGRLCETYDPVSGNFNDNGQFADSYLIAWD